MILLALRVDDVAPNGYAVDRATVRQSKTGRPVRFELTEVIKIENTVRYLGVEVDDALEIAEKIDI